MHFDYEISLEDYSAGMAAFTTSRLRANLIKLQDNPVAWIFLGLLLIVIAWEHHTVDWAPLIIACTGAWLLYAGGRVFFPKRYLTGHYDMSALKGQKFSADIGVDGFETGNELQKSHVLWAAVKLKGENKRAFVLYTGSNLHIFPKCYLSSEQQEEFRRLSGLMAK